MNNDYQEALRREDEAIAAIRAFARDNKDLLRSVWQWGDGYGGGVLEMVATEIGAVAYLQRPRDTRKAKDVIPAQLRTQVFERDAYRCVTCGGFKDLCGDHIHPESKGGPTTLENLQTMCRSCNSKKGAKHE